MLEADTRYYAQMSVDCANFFLEHSPKLTHLEDGRISVWPGSCGRGCSEGLRTARSFGITSTEGFLMLGKGELQIRVSSTFSPTPPELLEGGASIVETGSGSNAS